MTWVRSGYSILVLALLFGCNSPRNDAPGDLAARAERFFRGVYGCDPTVVLELAGNDVFVSYPMFQELFGAPAIRGRANVENFARGFCSRWQDAEITVHEAVAEGNQVVLMWSFRARSTASGEAVSWGGISLFQFDDSRRIIAEIGEESEPGPFERIVDRAEGVNDSI